VNMTIKEIKQTVARVLKKAQALARVEHWR
jgi:hypothetical protein